MASLEQADQSDLLGLTKAYCEAALPDQEQKKKVWEGIFGTAYDKSSLLIQEAYASGFRQHS